jgi:hypothetical protein
MKEELKKLKEMYQDYITNYSLDSAALSWEASRFLFRLMNKRKPICILDTGSGFSSALTRYYASLNPGVVCVTIEDDTNWLGVTRSFLEKYGLATQNLSIGLQSIKDFYFDFIIHDYSHVATGTRFYTLPEVAERMASNAVIYIDDMHMQDYHNAVLEFARAKALTLSDLQIATIDKFSRYGVLLNN